MYNDLICIKMKRFNKILMMTFSLAFLMFACNENEEPAPDNSKTKEPPYLTYESETDFWFQRERGDTMIAVVDVNGAYNATIAEGGEWCTVSEISVNYFKINYEENRKAEDRTTKITLSLEGVDDIEIVVSQRGPLPTLVIDSSYVELAVPYSGGDTAVLLRTNSNYKVEIEAGGEWCSVANKDETELKLNIPQNSGLVSRSAKVAISHTYLDSTVRFEFVVNQNPTPILLGSPEDGTEISRTSGFPQTLSWTKTGGISGYSVAVSTSNAFPEDATQVTAVGDVDSYALKLADIAEALALSYEIKVPLYWKVMPTNPDIEIATETKMFYVQRAYVSTLFPVTLNSGDSSWTGLDPDDDGYPMMNLGGGQSSRRIFMAIHPLTEAVPEGKTVAVSYEYKTSRIPSGYPDPALDVRHCVDGWSWDDRLFSAPLTEEWRPITAPLRLRRSDWGAVGNKFYFFIMPTTAGNGVSGMKFHFKDIRLEVYE
jgi:hypothetical protein